MLKVKPSLNRDTLYFPLIPAGPETVFKAIGSESNMVGFMAVIKSDLVSDKLAAGSNKALHLIIYSFPTLLTSMSGTLARLLRISGEIVGRGRSTLMKLRGRAFVCSVSLTSIMHNAS